MREVALYTWMSRGFGSTEVHDELALIEAGSYQGWSTFGWILDDEEVEAVMAPDHPDAHGAWAAFTATPRGVRRGSRPGDPPC